MLLDHDTLFTARWEAEELRRFASSICCPIPSRRTHWAAWKSRRTRHSLAVECSPDGSVPCGARSPKVCASEDQLEANGGLWKIVAD